MKLLQLSLLIVVTVFILGCSALEDDKKGQEALSKIPVKLGEKFNQEFAKKHGNVETLEGTNGSIWIAYYKDENFTIITDKKTNIIHQVCVGRGTSEQGTALYCKKDY